MSAIVSSPALLWPRRFAVALIVFYQRRLSPHKGFVCAHRRRHGGDSCSQYARRLAETQGVIAAWIAMPRRFAECRAAKAAIEADAAFSATSDLEGDADASKTAANEPGKAKRSSQSRGACDLVPMGACDLGLAGADCSAVECGGCAGAGACG